MNQDPRGETPPSPPPGVPSVPSERRAASDRRQGERRQREVPVPVDRRAGDERRKTPDRRRGVSRYELSADEMEFVQALQRFKERTGKPFPTWSEVLSVLRSLGYEKRG